VNCPYCRFSKLKVLDKRDAPQNAIRRRRECLGCHRRFTTRERISALDLVVIKRDGRKQKYDREKLARGIQRSCEKRPILKEEVDQLITEVESNICGLGKKEIKSSTIGNLVLKSLKKADKVAYLRFASVFYPFVRIDDFEKEIERLVEEGRKTGPG